MLSNRLILCHPFSFCLSSFPASGSFPVSCLFTSGGQSIRASASATVLPMNIQGWFPLGLTGWISLQSKGPSGVFCSITVWKHQFSGAQPSSWSSFHIPCVTGKTMLVLRRSSRVQLSVTPWTVAHQAPLSMGFSRQDAGVGRHALLQGIFLTQGLNLRLLRCRQILYHWVPRETHWTNHSFDYTGPLSAKWCFSAL